MGMSGSDSGIPGFEGAPGEGGRHKEETSEITALSVAGIDLQKGGAARSWKGDHVRKGSFKKKTIAAGLSSKGGEGGRRSEGKKTPRGDRWGIFSTLLHVCEDRSQKG